MTNLELFHTAFENSERAMQYVFDEAGNCVSQNQFFVHMVNLFQPKVHTICVDGAECFEGFLWFGQPYLIFGKSMLEAC